MHTGKPGEEETGRLIGANLKQFRISHGKSIDSLAREIGVSRLTLLNIEKGEANPTLSVIWRIANGLRVPITALLTTEPEVAVNRRNDALKLASPNRAFVVELLFHSNGLVEFYRGYLQPQSEYVSEPHRSVIAEFVTVMSGRLIVEVDGETHSLDEYDAIRFRGDTSHKYVNPSSSVTVMHFAMAYADCNA